MSRGVCPFCKQPTEAWSTDGGCMKCYVPGRTRVFSIGFESKNVDQEPVSSSPRNSNIPNRPHKKNCQPKVYEGALSFHISCTCYPVEFKLYEEGDNLREEAL